MPIVQFITFCLLVFLSPSSSGETPSFQKYYQQYQMHLEAGEILEALDMAKAAFELSQEKLGNDNQTTQTLGFNYAQLYVSEREILRDYEPYRAIRLINKYIDYLSNVNATDRLALIDPLMSLAKAQLWYPEEKLKAKKEFRDRVRRFSGDRLTRSSVEFQEEQGVEGFKRALSIAREAKNSYPLLSHDLEFEIARELFSKGVDVELAEQLLTSAYDGYDKQLKHNDTRRVMTAFWLGRAKMFSNKTAAANDYLKVVVQAYESEGDLTNQRLIETYNHIIQNYESLGQSDQATPYVIALGKTQPWYALREQEPLYQPYPVSTDDSGEQTIARYRLTIDENGYVIEIENVAFQGDAELKDLLPEAIKRWRYAPKFVDGTAVTAETEATIRI